MRCGEPVSLVAPCFSVYYDLVQRISSMRTYWLVFAAGLLTVGNLHAGLILQYETSNVGSTPTGDPIFRFTYFLSGGSLNAGDELEIDFDPALYGELSNASAGAGFDVALFQTNNPPGSTGIYSALAIVNNPSLATPFMTDAVYLGQGTPAPQPVFINQYDASGDADEQHGDSDRNPRCSRAVNPRNHRSATGFSRMLAGGAPPIQTYYLILTSVKCRG